jgi:diguanylate cyclase (GGDEF)-like protein
MGLTDREAADLRVGDAVAKAYKTLARHEQSNRHMPGLGFRNGLIEATGELAANLVEIYAAIDGAGERPLRDELVKVVTDRVKAFIQSSVASQRGANAAMAAREGVNLAAVHEGSIGRNFDLAVYERAKQQPAPKVEMPVARAKQDKFEILDSPRLYDPDFKRCVGVLGVSVIYFDLDNFKALNTEFTEPVVDRTLLPELQRLIAALSVDRGFAYAEGGDEFIVTLANTNTALAEAFTALLLDKIRSTSFQVDDRSVTVTASAGIASSMSPDDAQRCREAASAAKRTAKEQGKDRYAVSDLRT